MKSQNALKQLFILTGSFIFFFIAASIFWDIFVNGRLYYCSDKMPVLDLIPPFVHGPQYHDYYLVSPVVVYLIWVALIFAIVFLTLILSKEILNKKTKP